MNNIDDVRINLHTVPYLNKRSLNAELLMIRYFLYTVKVIHFRKIKIIKFAIKNECISSLL